MCNNNKNNSDVLENSTEIWNQIKSPKNSQFYVKQKE